MDPALQPPILKLPGATAQEVNRDNNKNGSQQRLLWIMIGLIIVLAFAVLILLPSIVDRSMERSTEAIPPVDRIKSNAPELQAVQNPSTERHDAELNLQAFLRMRAHPDLNNAQSWAKDEWKNALATADSGDDLHGQGLFNQASNAYENALNELSTILQSRPQRLEDALTRGQHLLAQNQSQDAGVAFELALALEPGQAEATVGLERASVRDQVLVLIDEGKKMEVKQEFSLALDTYRKAVQLDPMFDPAQEAQDSVELVLAEKHYQDSMSKALSQMEIGNFRASEEALNTASSILPDSPEVKDARQRLVEAIQLQTLTQLRIQADQYTKIEKWNEAATSYKSALKIDPQATFAKTGLLKAEGRLELHAQIDHYLSDPGRLTSIEPLVNAKKLLKGNSNISSDEPELKSKVARLQEAVRLSEEPVMLSIQSDNETEISIYHVGQFGKFHNQKLSLKPGKYTVVGFRPGYRDVRKVVTLGANKGETQIVVRCEELI